MLTGGHIAASYLISEGAKSIGIPITSIQQLGVIVAGNLPDVDFLTGFVTGKKGEKHHQNLTHTPLGMILIWFLLLIIFDTSNQFSLVLFVSLILHLAMDDLGHWMYKLGLIKFPVGPQINWLYPLTEFSKHKLIETYNEALNTYLKKAWPIAALELLIIFAAVILFIKSNY